MCWPHAHTDYKTYTLTLYVRFFRILLFPPYGSFRITVTVAPRRNMYRLCVVWMVNRTFWSVYRMECTRLFCAGHSHFMRCSSDATKTQIGIRLNFSAIASSKHRIVLRISHEISIAIWCQEMATKFFNVQSCGLQTSKLRVLGEHRVRRQSRNMWTESWWIVISMYANRGIKRNERCVSISEVSVNEVLSRRTNDFFTLFCKPQCSNECSGFFLSLATQHSTVLRHSLYQLPMIQIMCRTEFIGNCFCQIWTDTLRP